MVRDLEEVVQYLSNLSQADLKYVRDRCDALLNFIKPRDQEDKSAILYECIKNQMDFAGAQTLPFRAFTKTRLYPAFNKAADIAVRYVEEFVKPKTVMERMKAYTILASLILDECRAQGRGIEMFQVTFRLSEAHNIFEKAFPGYAASGVLRQIVLDFQLVNFVAK